MINIPNSYNGKKLVHSWTYHAMNGAVLGTVGRYQHGAEKKDIVPYFKSNGAGWTAGIDLVPKPLFGLDKLASYPKESVVFIVEGEKKASAFIALALWR
jgi:hypothetical protein